MEEIIVALWLFLPAGLANMMAAQASHYRTLDFLAISVDQGIEFRGKRLLGKNKTLRGYIFGTFFGLCFALTQVFMYENLGLSSIFDLDYSEVNIVMYGALVSFGALLGDSVESFFKRQKGVAPGSPWFPFDQIDYILGGLILGSTVYQHDLSGYIAIFVVYFFGHLIFKALGYYLKLDDKKI